MKLILSFLAVAQLSAVSLASVLPKPQAGSSPLQFAPLDTVRSDEQRVAPLQSSDEDCLTVWGTFPTWDPEEQRLKPWLAYQDKCADGLQSLGLEAVNPADEHLYWISQVATEQSIGSHPNDWSTRLAKTLGQTSHLDAIPTLVRPDFNQYSSDQFVLQQKRALPPRQPEMKLVHERFSILALPATEEGDEASVHIDKYLPFDTYISKMSPMSKARSNAYLQTLLLGTQSEEPDFGEVEYNPLIGQLLKDHDMDKEQIRKTVEILSGENQKSEFKANKNFKGWDGRHSGTWGARNAAQWLRG